MARNEGNDYDDEFGTKRTLYAAFTAHLAIAAPKSLRYL